MASKKLHRASTTFSQAQQRFGVKLMGKQAGQGRTSMPQQHAAAQLCERHERNEPAEPPGLPAPTPSHAAYQQHRCYLRSAMNCTLARRVLPPSQPPAQPGSARPALV